MHSPFVPKTAHDVEPRLFWDAFFWLCEIPRPSGGEARVIAALREGFERVGCPGRTDAAGNLVVRVAASPGLESAPVVVLQSHVDMVAGVADGHAHDWARDPVRWVRNGDWIGTEGQSTTLGADNGLGVASCIAAAFDPSLAHGPLELLFTVEEETGLTGAKKLEGAMVSGRTLLNMDSEEDGVVYVGCAGSRVITLGTAIAAEPAPAGLDRGVRVALSHVHGGHSGVDIHRGRANANAALAALLGDAAGLGAANGGATLPFALAHVAGGDANNRIAAHATATLAVRAADLPAWNALAARHQAALRARFAEDAEIVVGVEPAGLPARAWSPADTRRAIGLLRSLHHGVIAMSAQLPELVETSCNIAIVRSEAAHLEAVVSVRSSNPPALEATLGRIAALGALAGFEASVSDGYPAWPPTLESPLLDAARAIHAERHGGEALPMLSIHAGLETAVLGEKLGGAQMISYGADIRDAHSPRERACISSVARFLDFHYSLIARLARQPAREPEAARA